MVDIVHTDGGVLGADESTGTVDFFANGGLRLQPGCPPTALTFSLSPESIKYFFYVFPKNLELKR